MRGIIICLELPSHHNAAGLGIDIIKNVNYFSKNFQKAVMEKPHMAFRRFNYYLYLKIFEQFENIKFLLVNSCQVQSLKIFLHVRTKCFWNFVQLLKK
jgi:hypothetical protein